MGTKSSATTTPRKAGSRGPRPDNAQRREKAGWALVVLVSVSFALANWALEFAPLGRWMQFTAFSALHALLPPFAEKAPQVVVVDIHAIHAGENQPTSRAALRAILADIAAQDPAAIGVDIDFTPAKPQTQEEQEFLHSCLDLTHGAAGKPAVPIFLGVYPVGNWEPKYWFGDSDDNDMAAYIGAHGSDTRRLPRWIDGPAYGGHGYLRSMGEALAESYLASRHETMPGPVRSALLMESAPADPRDDHGPVVSGMEEDLEKLAP
jgi:hypothetical protein